MTRLVYIISIFTIILFCFMPLGAMSGRSDSTGTSRTIPLPCRLQDAEIEYSSESWGCTEKILLYGNGMGTRTFNSCFNRESVQRNIRYTPDDFIYILSEFLFGNFFSVGTEYHSVIDNVYIANDSMIGWAKESIVDIRVVNLTLRLKDYSKTVSFFPDHPEFMAPAALDSIARHILLFADEHTVIK